MGCNCGSGGPAGNDQYQAVAQDGTVVPIDGTRMSGTLGEARTKVGTMTGGWVKKVAGS